MATKLTRQSLHILFATPAFPPFPGGGERYARSLAVQLKEQGHQVTVLTTNARTEQDFWAGGISDQVSEESVGGIHIIRCPIGRMPGARPGVLVWRKLMVLLSLLPGDQATILSRMARSVPPIRLMNEATAKIASPVDLVHGFNISWEHALIVGWQFARRQQIPFVVTPFAHFGTGYRDRVALNATMDHQLRIMSDADALLVLTAIEAERLHEYGINPAKVTVIGGGMDPLPISADQETIISSFNLETPYVLFVGRANYDKGAIHAVKAICRLRGQGVPVTLVMIGQTTPEFERLMNSLSASQRAGVHQLGILSDIEKHALLAASSMLLLPSQSDSFGIVFLEAWAHSKPVIGAHAGGIPGVVDDGENGILVDFGDIDSLAAAVEQLLTNRDLAIKMGAQGHQKVSEQYSWERVAKSVLLGYQSALDGIDSTHRG